MLQNTRHFPGGSSGEGDRRCSQRAWGLHLTWFARTAASDSKARKHLCVEVVGCSAWSKAHLLVAWKGRQTRKSFIVWERGQVPLFHLSPSVLKKLIWSHSRKDRSLSNDMKKIQDLHGSEGVWQSPSQTPSRN